MALYTLADLHLATDVAKPMDIFGGRWEGHTDKIIRHWRELIAPEDTVVLGGDISWGISLAEAKGDFALIPLGVAMELPKGYEAHVVPRSSTFKNFGIIQTNHMGVIDESYCGDNDQWHFPAYALRDTVIHVNDRICQFRIMEHQPKIVFEETEKLDNKDRGGIGSTGKN